jgi:hypothetical protein
MIINELDPLGKDLSEILVKVKQYKEAYNEFIQLYKKNEIWNVSDKDDVYNLIEVCTSNICNILMRIYISIANQEIHPFAQRILDRLIFNSLTDQFSIILKSGKDENISMVHYHFFSIVLESLLKHKIGLDLFSNPHIGKETKNLVGALLHLTIFPSDERRLSDYVLKYYNPIIGHSEVDQVKAILKKYDIIMNDSGIELNN